MEQSLAAGLSKRQVAHLVEHKLVSRSTSAPSITTMTWSPSLTVKGPC
jgi:hypothetical protein